MDNNCYFLICGDQALLIDAADDAQLLLDHARDLQVTITTVATTHQHWDHVRALEEVLAATGAQHIASTADAPSLPAPVDAALNNGDSFSFAGHDLDVMVVRGHTPGGLCLGTTIDRVPTVFTGDSLFPGGVGKTDGRGDFDRLLDDVTEFIFNRYPDETRIYPGHGKSTTLGAERGQLGQWRARGW